MADMRRRNDHHAPQKRPRRRPWAAWRSLHQPPEAAGGAGEREEGRPAEDPHAPRRGIAPPLPMGAPGTAWEPTEPLLTATSATPRRRPARYPRSRSRSAGPRRRGATGSAWGAGCGASSTRRGYSSTEVSRRGSGAGASPRCVRATASSSRWRRQRRPRSHQPHSQCVTATTTASRVRARSVTIPAGRRGSPAGCRRRGDTRWRGADDSRRVVRCISRTVPSPSPPVSARTYRA